MPEAAPSPVKIVAISGSGHVPSASRRMLEIAVEGAASAGAITEVVDLVSLGEGPSWTAAHRERLRELVGGALGLLFAMPVEHESVTGILKHALDELAQGALEGKVAGLISIGGGQFGSGLALEHLRTVLRAMSCLTLPRQVILPEPQAGEAFLDAELRERLLALGAQVANTARQLAVPVVAG